MKQTIEVKFKCYACDTENKQSKQIDFDDDVNVFAFRVRRIEVTCSNPECEKSNTVEVSG